MCRYANEKCADDQGDTVQECDANEDAQRLNVWYKK